MQREPVVGYTAIGAAVSSAIMRGLAMAVSLGWLRLDTTQISAIEAFVGAVIALATLIAPPLVGAWLARAKVTPRAAPRTAIGQPAALVPLTELADVKRQE